MDANQTRFHLVFGEEDWLGDTPPGASPPAFPLEYRDSDATVGLPQKVFVFPAPTDARLAASARRGAAQDRYGNYYWIAPQQDEILFLGASQQQPQHFWSAQDLTAVGTKSNSTGFAPVSPSPGTTFKMGGLAVTTDHYLVVGLLGPAGLLVFDLHAQGPPLEYHWPAGVAFAPFDLAAAPGGGVWILDRANRQYWGLDSLFRAIAPLGGSGATFAEVGVLLQEMGRAAARSPFLGTVGLGVGALTLLAGPADYDTADFTVWASKPGVPHRLQIEPDLLQDIYCDALTELDQADITNKYFSVTVGDPVTGKGEIEVRGDRPVQVKTGENWVARKPGHEATTFAQAGTLPKPAALVEAN